MSKILVTGGSSMVGQHLKKYLKDATYISSKDCDLTDQQATRDFFWKFKPDIVIHLAAKVGGITDNINNAVEFFEQNVSINTNVVKESFRSGCNKIIATLSTCIYPDLRTDLEYPLIEAHLHQGPPTDSNFTYGYAKRSMQVHMDAYNKKYGTCYSTIVPCNLYSEYDHFEGDKAHFVASILQKVKDYQDGKTKEVTLFGDGTPLRQFMYADDLAKAINILLDAEKPFNYNLCNNENLSIKEIAKTVQESLDIDFPIYWNTKKPNGQYRKDASSRKFLSAHSNFEFTSLKDGIKLTYEKKFNT